MLNGWDGIAEPMNPEKRGCWYVAVDGSKVGHQFKYKLITKAGVVKASTPLHLASRTPLAMPFVMIPVLIEKVTVNQALVISSHGPIMVE
jgi:hypothetical protein